MNVQDYLAALQPSPEDEANARRQSFMAMAAAMLGNAKNLPSALSAGITAKMGSEAVYKEQRRRDQQQGIQAHRQAMEMAEFDRANKEREAKRSLAAKAFAPGFSPQGPMPDGGAMPQVPGGGGMEEYARGMMGIDPSEGIRLRGAFAKESPLAKIDPKDYTPESFKAFADSGFQNPGVLVAYRKPEEKGTPFAKINPADYTPDSFKRFAVSGKYEDLMPYRRPETQQGPAPVMIDTPEGKAWVYPPARGGSAPVPVTGPSGEQVKPPPKPLPDSIRKEIAGLDAQLAIIAGARDKVRAVPSAFSVMRGSATMMGAMPESVAGRFDKPEEREARSYVYNIVSKVINERAGAAQSAQELARLRSFLPAEMDSAKQIEDKLNAFEQYVNDTKKGYVGSSGAAAPGGNGWSIKRKS